MEQFLSLEEFGADIQDVPAPSRPDPLVQGPAPLLADMAKQTMPVKWQGQSVYKDEQGQMRYGSKKQVEPTFMSLEEFAGEPVKSSKPSTIGNIAGSAAMVGDMILGFPAFIGGFVANLGAAGGTAAAGSTREEAWAAGRHAQEAFLTGGPLAGWQSSPLGKLAELLGHKSTYDESSAAEVMGKVSSAIEDAGTWVQEKSGGSIPKDSVMTFADSLMVGMGPAGARLYRGVKAKMQARKPLESEVLPGGERIEPTIPGEKPVIEGTATTAMSPADMAKQHVNARYEAGYTNKEASQFWQGAGKEMRETFKTPAERKAYKQAKEALVAERKAGKTPAAVVEEKLAANPPKEMTLEEGMQQYRQEVLGEGKAARISEGDATRLYQTPPALRTAEQRLQIKRYEEGLRTQGQAGAIDPDLLAIMGASSLTMAGLGYLSQQEGGVSALPAIAATFIPVALTHPRVQRAVELKKQGVPRDQVWRQTGLFEEKGQWLREVSEAESKLVPGLPKQMDGKTMPVATGTLEPLNNVLDHQKLYDAVPGIENTLVGLQEGRGQGSFMPETNQLFLKPNTPEKLRSVAAHEIQHVVQEKYDMPRGGSPEHFLSPGERQFINETRQITLDVATDIASDMRRDVDVKQIMNVLREAEAGRIAPDEALQHFLVVKQHPQFPELIQALRDQIYADDLFKAAHAKYETVAGEVQARAVQKRLNMTELERRNTPPWESYDVPETSWTYLDKNGKITAAAAIAAGGWMFMHPEDAERIGVGSLVALGAIKGKGGMWHPEAVTRLAQPLKMALDRNIGMRVPTESDLAIHNWVDSRVKAWLNKHAGTATDPLNDVKIPMLGEDVRWEDLMDKSIISGKVVAEGEPLGKLNNYKQHEVPFARSGEEVFNVYGHPPSEFHALTNYLAHAGDYAREFIPPDKLQQYDLVRLIKETAKQDEVQAAKMAKARVNQAGTVTFKEYPDGMMWVEVGKVADGELPKGYKAEKVPDQVGGWRPVDAEGKLAVGDGERTRFDTKQEAEQAARRHIAAIALKNEGDVMGHCVGGYCEMVHSGESKIYSLRDEKGMSHVTVEVAPQEFYTNLDGDGIRRPVMNSKDNPPNIVQIKGKQNRAPVDKYLPYVQDFVKSSKWGDVGDLANTGLSDLRSPRSGLPWDRTATYELSKAIVDKYEPLGENALIEAAEKAVGRYPSADEFTAWARKETGIDSVFESIDGGGNPLKQRGSIDPDLAKKLGATAGGAAIGAYLDKDERLGGALAGGTLGLLGAAAMARPKGRNVPVNRGLDYALGEISTRIGNMGEMGPALKLQLRKFEGNVLSETKAVTDKVGPFMKDIKGLPDVIKQQVSLALLQQDMGKVRQLLAGSSEKLKNFAAVQQVLADFERVHKQMGRFKEGITDYFPRIVADYEGLQKHLGVQAAEGLDKWLNKAEKQMLKTENRLLTDVEQSILINRYLLADAPLSSLPPHLRKRTVREVTEQLQPFYEAPEMSLSRYVHAAVQDIEMAKLFGKNLKLSKASHGTRAINIDESIGAYVRDAKQAGHLTGSQEAQLKDILQSRFGPGEQGARPTIQHIRNVANMGLLGNFVSAATQFSDLAMAVYSQGLQSSLKAVGKTMTGRSINPKDFGLANHISEEFTGTIGSARALQKMFKYSGFSAVDMLGKRLLLTSALDKYQRWATTSKGQAKIAEKYQTAFGSDFADLLRDLRNKTKSDHVDTLLFSELSDLQPISKMEMPQAYLDMPNGRVVYMLKSFMLKQMDIVRRDMYQEMAKPGLEHKQKALANLTRYALTVGVAGATVDMMKDFILGKPFDAKWEDVPLNLLKTFGWSKYTLDKAASGRPAEAVIGMAMPPYAMMDDLIRRDPRAWNYVPIAGKIFYERNKETWKEQKAWERKHDPTLRMERRMKRLEEKQ